MRRPRPLAVLAIVLAGAVGVVSSTQTWLTATLTGAAVHELAVPGASALPVLAPLSLAVLALGLALSIVGLVLRYAFAVLAVASGVLLAVLTAQLLLGGPVASVASTVTDATGITGADAVAALVVGISPTAWPVVALAGWVLLVGAGVLTLATARRWPGAGRRFAAGTGHRPSAADAAAPGGQAPAPLDALDSWDGLSRGEDPTAGAPPR